MKGHIQCNTKLNCSHFAGKHTHLADERSHFTHERIQLAYILESFHNHLQSFAPGPVGWGAEPVDPWAAY
eukprot:5779728-Amphidinium_carterae.1